MKLINRRCGAAMVAASSILAIAGGASAQTTIGDTAPPLNSCFYIGSSGNSGQSFTVPNGVSSVRSVSIGVGNFGGSSQYRISLRSGPGTSELFGQNATATTSYISAIATEVLTIPGAGYPVSAGDTLFISVADVSPNNIGCAGPDSHVGGISYAQGGVFSSGDMPFQVVFNDAPPPVTVPTMTEWAMILFGLILAGGAALMIQRRRFAL